MLSRGFKSLNLSACAVGVSLGLAIAVPAGSADWSRSFVHAPAARDHSELVRSFAPLNEPMSTRGATGFQAGFDRDYGDLVLGGSFQQGRVPDSFGPGLQDDSQMLQLRAGIDLGRTLGYVTFGERQQGSDQERNQVIGLGVRVSVNRILQMSGEILHHAPASSPNGAALGDETLSFRAAFRF